ncbi:hypothetical protein EWM64_g7460 [Hericium alpestre]|uniref:Uncharacterized protein n=1 Tax=Hericium alpestre TaxID=135208 RepID=A0A4Y9ZP62_9AGAM|nr:hypothetical protein EWM64_g7460 [Hericium alpestre]
MPHQPPAPPSPGLPRTLYSGMSSLQIHQPGAGHNMRAPSLLSSAPAAHPPKAMFKSSKAEHAHRPSRRDHRYSTVLGKDHHQLAATAGRKRIMGDDAEFLASQYFWRPFPREMRAETQQETVHFLGALVNAFEKQKKNEETMLVGMNDLERQCAEIDVINAGTSQIWQQVHQRHAKVETDIERIILDLLRMSPDKEFTQICQKQLDDYYAIRRRSDRTRRQLDLPALE